MFAAKKINKNNSFTRKKEKSDKIIITTGIEIKLILLDLINRWLTLSSKNGHVAPKWVSANNKIVIIISSVSNCGKPYSTNA